MAQKARRAHPRAASDFSVKLRVAGGMMTSSQRLRNISLGGVFIEMKDPPAFGTECELEFALPVNPRVIRCKGFVVWSTKNEPDRGGGRPGIGVRLTDIGIPEMRAISEYVEKTSGKKK